MLRGALDLSAATGFSPLAGTRYTFLTYTGSLSGTLTYDASRWSVVYGLGTVSVQAVPEPASSAALGVAALALLRRRARRS